LYHVRIVVLQPVRGRMALVLYTHTRPFNGPLVRILLKQETVSGSSISWAVCKSAPGSRQTTTPAPHHSVLYRLDALPAAQPTASKHWRHLLFIINKNTLMSICLYVERASSHTWLYRECASVSACWRSSTDRAWSTEDASDSGTEYSNCIVELSPELFRTCQLRTQHTHTSSTPRKPTTGSCFNKCPKQLDKRPHRRALPVLGLPHLPLGPTWICTDRQRSAKTFPLLYTRTTHTHTRTHTPV